MRVGWKYVLTRHGERFVATLTLGIGIYHKQMLSVNSWDTLELVNIVSFVKCHV